LSIKWLNNPIHSHSHSHLKILSPFKGERKELIQSIQREIAKSQNLDIKLGDPQSGSWRAAKDEDDESNQTFDEYLEHSSSNQEPYLYIQKIGQFNQTAEKIISIVSDYLQIFHNVQVEICEQTISMEELKEKRKKQMAEHYKEEPDNLKECLSRMEAEFPRRSANKIQYKADRVLLLIDEFVRPTLKQPEWPVIAFTNEDLYSPPCNNFVFGLGSYGGTGIWSTARFGNPEKDQKAFNLCLLRTLKIAAHEFGHMRQIPHCTDYECNIGGYMSLTELDERPLLYCTQDTAKICYASNVNLAPYYKNLLKFFESFKQRYQLNLDFSYEIEQLSKRIRAIETI
jgi:archaemetzincin